MEIAAIVFILALSILFCYLLLAPISFLLELYEEQDKDEEKKPKSLFEKVITILLYLSLGYLWVKLYWWLVFDLILGY